MIPHSKPTIDSDDINAVARVLKSCQLGQGLMVEKFETAFKQFIDMDRAVATNSGTAALHLALLAMGIGCEDEVVMPSYVCTAILNAVNYVGAIPRLADINLGDFNINVQDVKRKITQKTKAIIIPHLFGAPADMDDFLRLGIPTIEDCAQSIGALYKGKKTGSFGDISIFSFYATKMMTTGEGGMALTRSERLYKKMQNLRDYDEKENYEIRYNYKMTGFQAALGLSQLSKLPFFLARRRQIASIYNDKFNSHNVELPIIKEDRNHIFYRYAIRVHSDINSVFQRLRQNGVEVKSPVYQPLHRYLGLDSRDFPNTEEVANSVISIPIYPSLSDDEVGVISDAICRVI